MALGGSSSASLLAVCYNAGLTEDQIWDAVIEMATGLQKVGSYGHLGLELKKVLDKIIPEDAHIKCNGNVFLGVTRIKPTYKPMIISEFESREDLIATL